MSVLSEPMCRLTDLGMAEVATMADKKRRYIPVFRESIREYIDGQWVETAIGQDIKDEWFNRYKHPPDPPENVRWCGWCNNSWPVTEGDECLHCLLARTTARLAVGVLMVYAMMFMARWASVSWEGWLQ